MSRSLSQDRRRKAKKSAKSGQSDRSDRSSPHKSQPGRRRVATASHTLDLFGEETLPVGFRYEADFLSTVEEQSLLQHIEGLPFREFEFHGFTGKRRIVSFGWRYDFNGGGLTKTEDMPDFLAGIRAGEEGFAQLAPGKLQQVLITEYSPGAAIGWHKDRQCLAMWSGFPFFPPQGGTSLAAAQFHSRAALGLSAAGVRAIRMGAQHSRRRDPALFHHIS